MVVVAKSDGLSQDLHVNKQKDYEFKCAIEALIQLVGVADRLTPFCLTLNLNDYNFVLVFTRN